MKNCLAICLFAVVLFSCHKDGDSLSNLADGTFEYKVNDTLVTVRNLGVSQGEYVNCFKSTDSSDAGYTIYSFGVQKGVNIILYFLIPTDSLHTGDYVIDTSTAKKFGVVVSMAFYNTASSVALSRDNMNIHISSYANGLVSGTFTAELSPTAAFTDYSLHGTTKITGGKFKNVRCQYY